MALSDDVSQATEPVLILTDDDVIELENTKAKVKPEIIDCYSSEDEEEEDLLQTGGIETFLEVCLNENTSASAKESTDRTMGPTQLRWNRRNQVTEEAPPERWMQGLNTNLNQQASLTRSSQSKEATICSYINMEENLESIFRKAVFSGMESPRDPLEQMTDDVNQEARINRRTSERIKDNNIDYSETTVQGKKKKRKVPVYEFPRVRREPNKQAKEYTRKTERAKTYSKKTQSPTISNKILPVIDNKEKLVVETPSPDKAINCEIVEPQTAIATTSLEVEKEKEKSGTTVFVQSRLFKKYARKPQPPAIASEMIPQAPSNLSAERSNPGKSIDYDVVEAETTIKMSDDEGEGQILEPIKHHSNVQKSAPLIKKRDRRRAKRPASKIGKAKLSKKSLSKTRPVDLDHSSTAPPAKSAKRDELDGNCGPKLFICPLTGGLFMQAPDTADEGNLGPTHTIPQK